MEINPTGSPSADGSFKPQFASDILCSGIFWNTVDVYE